MGLDAQVIAIGPFSREVLNVLEYAPEVYGSVNEGDTVINNVFIAMTSEQSYLLAECFGTSAWALGTHHLDPNCADVQRLLASDFAEDVPRFLSLREAEFEFYYLPNG